MDQLGRFALLLGVILAPYGMVAAAVGARTRRPALVDSARRTSFVLLACVVTANVAMVIALLQNDFAIRYVAENSSLETPVFFKVLSLWAADDGSLLLWNLILSGYITAVALRFRKYRPVTFPYALAVLNAVQIFYLILVNGPSRPFQTLANPPADGAGPPAHPGAPQLGFSPAELQRMRAGAKTLIPSSELDPAPDVPALEELPDGNLEALSQVVVIKLNGGLATSINALMSVRHPHHFLGITQQGQSAVFRTRGNSHAHLVLRGGGGRGNYDAVSIAMAERELQTAGVPATMSAAVTLSRLLHSLAG